MKISILYRLLMVVFLFSGICLSIPYDNDTIFPTPTILKSNVAFWTKIYTEVSMSEGLFHDRDYPLVIFEKITAEGSSRRVKTRKKEIASAINRINNEPQTQWTDFEHQIFALYKKEAGESALKDAADRVRFQQGQKERFKEGLRRSGLYIDTIRTILKKYGVPLRLAYLPHVESSFNTEAYSKVGAAGLWQFMRGTGKLYGMRIDYTIDERRDPVTATTAAAKYLSSSYRDLGNWPLAITSYNHGVYGMKKAVSQTGSRDLGIIIQNYKSRSFQFASSNFYGCFIAASYIAENHSVFFPDVKLYPPLKYADFTLAHYISANDFCRFMDIPKEQLMHLNPALRPAVFSGNKQLPKDFILHIPGTRTAVEIASTYRAIPDSFKTTAPPRPKYYRVDRGDNLYTIAARFGVSVADLAYENNITKVNRIRAGQVLNIPSRGGATPALAVASSVTSAHVATSVETMTVAANSPQGEGSKEKSPPTIDAVIEIAQAEQIAGLPPEEAAIAEHSETASVSESTTEMADQSAPAKSSKEKRGASSRSPQRPAQLPMSDSLKEIAFAPALYDSAAKPDSRPRVASSFDVALYNLDALLSPVGAAAKITVSIDETIGHYADWLGIPTWRIRKLNDMGRRSTIQVNRSITIPIDRPDALEQFAAARLEYHMAIEEDFYGQYTIVEVNSYRLRRGETLWDICNNNENPIPLWLLRKYNRHVDMTKLYPGSEIWVPQIRELTEDERRKSLAETLINPLPSVRMRLQESKLIP